MGCTWINNLFNQLAETGKKGSFTASALSGAQHKSSCTKSTSHSKQMSSTCENHNHF